MNKDRPIGLLSWTKCTTMTLVSMSIRYVLIFAWVPRVRALNKGGVGKTSYFLPLCVDRPISKTVRDTTKVTTNNQ